MNSLKPLQWVAVAAVSFAALYLLYTHLPLFGDMTFLGGILLLEVIIACLWKFDQRFLVLLMITFVWAGMRVPLQGAWTAGRWLVLAAGAVAGFIVWVKDPRKPFGPVHLVGFFCACAAFVSASVSPFTQMAMLKALSLSLLFLYCSAGARAAVIGREDHFFRGLLRACEIVVYGTAICYLVLGLSIWGNPNSMGAAMSIGLFPVLLWGWLTREGTVVRFRLLCALMLCTYLVFVSSARAGMIAVMMVTLVFCFCLHQYKLLIKAVAIVLVLIAVAGVLNPRDLDKKLIDTTDELLYKGHKEQGLLGSRLSPWEKTVQTIKQHPWFGTGYGTSATGEDPGLSFGTIASSAETAREHGSSYMTIAEWVGLLGVAPFAVLLVLTLSNVWRVCVWMNRTTNPRHYSIPLAMVVLSGVVHAGFEDWLFAVGSYPCVYFWVFAFILADLVPQTVAVPVPGASNRSPRTLPADYGAFVPNSVLSNR